MQKNRINIRVDPEHRPMLDFLLLCELIFDFAPKLETELTLVTPPNCAQKAIPVR